VLRSDHSFGTYVASGSTITITDFGSTELYSMEPEGEMDQERAFLAALVSAGDYGIAGARLELLDVTGSVILAFESAPATA